MLNLDMLGKIQEFKGQWVLKVQINESGGQQKDREISLATTGLVDWKGAVVDASARLLYLRSGGKEGETVSCTSLAFVSSEEITRIINVASGT